MPAQKGPISSTSRGLASLRGRPVFISRHAGRVPIIATHWLEAGTALAPDLVPARLPGLDDRGASERREGREQRQ